MYRTQKAKYSLMNNLYSKLVEILIQKEEPEDEDITAIRSRDKVASESELLKVLNA